MAGPAVSRIAARLVAGVLLPACGRVDFDRLPASATDVDAAIDVAPSDGPPPCSVANDFGTPVRVTELSSSTVGDGTLRLLPDELSGYYWSGVDAGPNGGQEIYLVTRPAWGAPFTSVLVQGGVNTVADELDPVLSPDGALLLFRRNGPGDDLFMAPRQTPDTFGAATAIATLNSTSVDAQVFMPIGVDDVYYQSRRSGAGDLYRSQRTGTTFSAPVLIGELATPDEEGDPVVTPDGLAIYFRSDRVAVFGGHNIYVATRATTGDPFGAPALVPNVNSEQDDGPSWISPDGCRLYMSSARAGTNDIYVATRPL